MSRVFLERIESDAELSSAIDQALTWTGARDRITSTSRVFIKPNLTWKDPTPGVTTTPRFIRALVERLHILTPNITIGESNGGQDCFWAADAFRGHGLYDLVNEFGIRLVNLSEEPSETARTTVGMKTVELEMPSILLHDIDFFITAPVPKVHAMTGVSLAFKNQWGCLGNSMRVNQHPRFSELIVAINKLLPGRFAFCDGTYMLDRTGPLVGDPVRMDVLVASDDLGAASLACCEIMQIDPRNVRHFRVARAEGMFPSSLAEATLNRSPVEFRRHEFRLQRSPIHYINLAAFHNRFLNRAFYDSATADALHEVLWFIRRNPLVRRFLYGQHGPGEARRHGAY